AATRWPPGARNSLRRLRTSMIGKDSLMAYRSAFNHVVAWSPRTVPVSVTGEAALSSGGFPTGFLPFMGHGASLVVEPAADVAAVLEVDHRRPHVAGRRRPGAARAEAATRREPHDVGYFAWDLFQAPDLGAFAEHSHRV